jgi:hypothetical protein
VLNERLGLRSGYTKGGELQLLFHISTTVQHQTCGAAEFTVVLRLMLS